jgi:hypothetical protein
VYDIGSKFPVLTKGGIILAYETKVILKAIAEIVISNDSQRDIYEALSRIANAEGIVLPPFDEVKKEKAGTP